MKTIIIVLATVYLFFTLFGNGIKVNAETFQWPSSGFIGWIFKSDNFNSDGSVCSQCHNGIDIWSNKNGGWNNGVSGSSNPVYPTSNGTVLYVFTNEPKGGYRIKHNDSLYTNYWHVKDRKVSANTTVNSSTLLGYQDNDVSVHLHLTVASTNSDTGIDPSSYYGMQLNKPLPNSVGYLTTEVKSQLYRGTNPILANWNLGSATCCSALGSITIMPESNLSTPTGEIVIVAT